jgi:molecular chaperone Hsp33
LTRALSADGRISVRALVGTGIAAEGARRHETGALATAALGRTLLGGVLLGSLGKGEETLQLHFSGDGPLRSLVAISDVEGRVRGNVGEPHAELPLAAGSLDVARGIGLGRLSVLRYAPSWREPYTGIVPIVSGEVAEDLALYLTESEQTPSAVGLGLRLSANQDAVEVEAAGGFLAQVLPGPGDPPLDRLEANVAELGSVSERIFQGATARDLARLLLAGLGGDILGEGEPRFHCDCANRVERAVTLIGEAALDEHTASGEPIEVRCEFCASVHLVDARRAQARSAASAT